ncbi:flagellar biosynthetic protein FliR [Kosakonia sacchari]|uniref:EscT/YscT/HrcT family type III secretion system export apparatus protein n=1 Tax=Kosakonia sacchari TaxID=1158459 RepID=UPI002ACE29E1|nr:flagellar biosynthetic protein FliR [Kosakonia sacchari]MDZ7324109.1 flagellar biosynthetic protein FliR [Kosakonia sacchari]
MTFVSFDWLGEALMALVSACARIYPCMAIIIAFSFKEIRGAVLYSIALVFTLLPATTFYTQPDFGNIKGIMFIFMMIKESLLGIFLGFLLVVPFWLFESVGVLFDNQSGGQMGEQINPAITNNGSFFGYVFKSIFLLIFIHFHGFAYLIDILWRSYTFWPIDKLFFINTAVTFKQWLAFLADIFSFIVIYSAPFAVLMLMIEFSVAILSLYSPKMQVTTVTIPLKIIIGLSFLVVYIPILLHLAEQQLLQPARVIPMISSTLNLKAD